MKVGIKKQQCFKFTDLDRALKGLSARQKTHQIAKMKDAEFIKPLGPNGRTYYINFMNNFLMRGLIQILKQEGFFPPIDQ